MPSTINGIGTHYYGKRDVVSRTGSCRQCGAQGKLDSYTSRLWFVIVFIPIIPLKRVRILDYCSRCSRHWVADPEQYETSRQLAVSGALEKYRDHSSVETALAAHVQLLSFHMHKEADAFREAALAQFPEDVELRLGCGSHLDQTGRWADATPLYEQAFELNPNHPSARHALAWRRTNANQLDEAYELLDFLRQPGAGQSFDLALLETLARSYQKQKNHERVLEICQHLLREVPHVGEHHAFRKLVSQSERAVHQTASLLPAKSFSIRGLFDSKSVSHAPWVRWAAISSVAAFLFVLGMAGLNEYRRTHRSLYVLNGFAQPVDVSIDGQTPIHVADRKLFPLAEGKHQIVVTGPVTKQQEIAVQSGYWSRWNYSPIWIFNVEKLVAVAEASIHYSAIQQPPTTRWLFDSELSYVPHVDYAFEPPPHSLTVKGKNTTVTKIHVGTTVLPPTTVFSGIQRIQDRNVVMTYAEGHLNRNPNDAGLLRMYFHYADDDADRQRVTDFLKAGLWRMPISVSWHRMYTELKSVAADEAAMINDYDAHLQQDPNNGNLLYLRGRVGLTRADQLIYFRLANEKDPGSGWAAYSLAYDAANRGEWREAKEYCDKSLTALRSDLWYRSLRHFVQIANGEAGNLEPEYKPLLQSQDSLESLMALLFLVDTLASQQKYDEARQVAHQWLTSTSGPDVTAETLSALDTMLDYVCGNLESLRQSRGKAISMGLAQYDFHALLALGDPDAAVKMAGADKLLEDWPAVLAVSLAYSLAGNPSEADQWRSRACDKLKEHDSDRKRAALLLQRDQAPTQDELDEISLAISETPLFLAALGQRFPDGNSKLNQRAQTLNVCRMPPSLLVKQAIEKP